MSTLPWCASTRQYSFSTSNASRLGAASLTDEDAISDSTGATKNMRFRHRICYKKNVDCVSQPDIVVHAF